MRVFDDEHLQGKIFVQYIALIIFSAIKKTMNDKDLYRTYTSYSLLDELDVIEFYHHPGSAGHWGETTKKQRDLLAAFGLDLCVQFSPRIQVLWQKGQVVRSGQNVTTGCFTKTC